MSTFICQGPVIGTFSKEEAKAAGKKEIEGHNKRKGCGYCLDKIIADVPDNGEDHKIKCPKCKNVSVVKKLPMDDE